MIIGLIFGAGSGILKIAQNKELVSNHANVNNLRSNSRFHGLKRM